MSTYAEGIFESGYEEGLKLGKFINLISILHEELKLDKERIVKALIEDFKLDELKARQCYNRYNRERCRKLYNKKKYKRK